MNVFELLASKGIEVKPSSSNENEFKINCLFCVDMGEAPDERFRCGFNIESGLGHCFNCGWSSKKAVLAIVRKLGAEDFDLEQIQQQHFTGKTRTRPAVVKLPEGFEPLDELKKERLAKPAWDYIRKRGITEEQVKRHEIGIAPFDYVYRDRIIFPVKDPEGKLLGVVSRDYTGDSFLRYRNSEGLKVIFNANPVQYPKSWIILSEGIFKALAIEKAVDNRYCSGAMLGANVTDTQWACLRGFKEAILFPDPDRAGIIGFLGVAANLAPHLRVSFVWPWPEKQADDLEPKVIRELLKHKRPYNELFQLQMRLAMNKL